MPSGIYCFVDMMALLFVPLLLWELWVWAVVLNLKSLRSFEFVTPVTMFLGEI